MKLSDLVHFLNLIDRIDVKSVSGQMLHELAGLTEIIKQNNFDINYYKVRVNKKFQAVEESLTLYEDIIKKLRLDLNRYIVQREKNQLELSNRHYREFVQNESVTSILSRRLPLDNESNTILRSRLRICANWQYPGMIIRPAHETFIEDLVPLDPLYIVDTDESAIEPSLEKFNSAYRARLRTYIIKETQTPILGKLPANQFGLVFAYNFFNYRPVELIESYMHEIFESLRLGGQLFFTFNNCDRAHGVQLAEKNYMSYTTAQRIRNTAERLGYDIVYQHQGAEDLCWIELIKPGKITSIRGSQTLAKIVEKK
jgi:hypothetical protein